MLETLWKSIGGDSAVGSLLESILNATIFKLCYYIETGLCRIIALLSQLFGVFAGLKQASYEGKGNYLINIFFSNKAVSNIYWAMALIGIILTFVFAIWAVIKKMFDLNGADQQSMGQIIGGGVKSVALILSMTLIISVVLSATNLLMEQLNLIFNDPEHLDQPVTRTFTGEEYAAMGRILSTIGNYSMVTAGNSRYNLNMCFNDIRGDLYYLKQQGVFDYSYYKTDKYNQKVDNWQSILFQIATSADLTKDIKVDLYNQGVANSITAAMDYLRNNETVRPLDSVTRQYIEDGELNLDRLVFLMGTMRAARNPQFNDSPSLDDSLRGPYYYNQGRSIYDFDRVDKDFNIGFPTDYIVVWVAAIAVIFDLVVILLNCVARIFNMMFLYIIAPPVIAAGPLDNGGKYRQWSIAFLVQSLSVFGTVIAMRLLLIYLPIVMDPKLVLFDPDKQAFLNMFAKFVLVFGGFETAKKATGLLTGILADSAGMQSVAAGDMSSSASSAIGAVTGVGKKVLGTGLGIAKGVTGFALRPLTNTIKRPFKQAADKWNKLGTGGRQDRAERAYADEQELKKVRAAHERKEAEKNKPAETKPENKQTLQPSTPPPLPTRFSRDDSESGSMRREAGTRKRMEERGKFDSLKPDEVPRPAPREAGDVATRNRPSLDD